MARIILFLVLAVVIARTFWRFVDAILRGAVSPAPQAGRRASGPPASVKMSQCPVCGTYVVPGKAISLVSGATTLFFDSEKCRAEYQSR